MSRIFHEAPPPPRPAFLQHSNIVWWLKRDVTRDIDYTWPRPTQLLYKSSHLRKERERVEKESARRDDGSMPSPETNRLFVSLDASLFAVFTPSNCLVSNRGIKSDSNRLPFTSPIPLLRLSLSFPLRAFHGRIDFSPRQPDSREHDERPRRAFDVSARLFSFATKICLLFA